MTAKTGNCPQCGGVQLAVDPDEDRVLFGIFGAFMHEHLPGCPEYPETTEVELTDL